MDALSWSPPAAFAHEFCPGRDRGEDLAMRWAYRARVPRGMCLCSGASTISLMSATSAVVSWLGLVLGHEDRSSKPQTAVEARFHRWYRPDSRCTICKITARGRNGFALVMARRIPALALPSGSRSPARVKPEARRIARRIRTTAARMRTRRSSFVMVSTNCCLAWSGGSMVTTGREPRRRQVDMVERGMVTCLGRHLVPVLTTCSRIRWSYAQRVQSVAVGVSSIAKVSSALAHQASKETNDIEGADVANTKCERSAHTAGMRQVASTPARHRQWPVPAVRHAHAWLFRGPSPSESFATSSTCPRPYQRQLGYCFCKVLTA